MLLGQAACFFMGLILHISGADRGDKRICALKGTSVDLPCSTDRPTDLPIDLPTDLPTDRPTDRPNDRPTSNMNWYTVHWNRTKFVLTNFSADGNHTVYNKSAGSDFTLTINDVEEDDEDFYCCGDVKDRPGHCWFYRNKLQVTDLQVKVIPTSDGNTVTLMCSTSCPLTETPAAYIWYKNGEFLYEDWSPWYQQLVSSEEDVTYSCAVKGYEDLKAPGVSVDYVSSICFSVTYAGGTMCSYVQKPQDEKCTITYPTELHIQRTLLEGYYVRLTCATNCPVIDPRTAYRWYSQGHIYQHHEGQTLTAPLFDFSCAIKGHTDLHADVVCGGQNCNRVNYVRRRICAAEGSSVNISSEYSSPNFNDRPRKIWFKTKKRGDPDELKKGMGRLEYHDIMNSSNILTIKNLRRDDSTEYSLRLLRDYERWERSDYPGVTLIVTGLKVTMAPSAVVTVGQRVTLTCSTSCPLNTDYIWYLNGRPLILPENQNKQLVLDPVGNQHAGNYSCAFTTQGKKSAEVELIVQGMSMAVINAVRLAVVFLIPIPLLLFHLWLRCSH